MDVTPLIPSDRQVIDAYRPGEFQVSGVIHQGPILVFPDHTESWNVSGFADLAAGSFARLHQTGATVDIVLLGTGARMQLFPSRLRRELRQAGLVVEVMDTGAACRTYTVLLAEERRVAAALLPI